MEQIDVSSFSPRLYIHHAVKNYNTFARTINNSFQENDTADALLFAQQAIEKCFKHVLCLRGARSHDPIMTSHNLRDLANACKFNGVTGQIGILSWLSSFYYEGRYPGEGSNYSMFEPSPHEVRELVPFLEAVMKFTLECEIDGRSTKVEPFKLE